MAAPNLQRSMETFRRSGSSGLVWQDRFISEDLSRAKHNGEGGEQFRELRPSRSVGSAGQMERSHSNGGSRPFRTGRISPAVDPPSPKLSGCGFCGIFRNSSTATPKKKPTNPRRR